MARRALVAVVLLLVAGCPRARDESAKKSAAPIASALTCRTLPSCTDPCADTACAEACTRRLTAVARPVYDELQACVVPACADGDGGTAPCRAPGSLGCKMCVLAHCAAQASRCMAN